MYAHDSGFYNLFIMHDRVDLIISSNNVLGNHLKIINMCCLVLTGINRL